MDILKQKKYNILKLNDDCYIFYNSINHFATKIDRLTLHIFNLIYKYNDLNIILQNIDEEYHDILKEIYNKVIQNKILTIKEENAEKDLNQLQFPSKFYLHLTYKCNMKCTYCYNKDIRTHIKQLSTKDWIKILDQILPYANYIVFTGGEVFLYKKLGVLIQYIKTINPNVFIEIISNGMSNLINNNLFDEIFNNINHITLSCDSLSLKNQERINFIPDVFMKNLQYIKTKYPKLKITISSIYMKNSEKNLADVSNFAESQNISTKTVLIIPNNKAEAILLPSLKNYKQSFYDYKQKLPVKRKFCGAGIGVCSIDPTGNLYPCHNLHYDEFLYGNILKTTYISLIKSDISLNFRYKYDVDKINVCCECNLKYICAGGCRAATYRIEGNMLNYPKILCPYNKEEALNKLKNIP
jgi:radical SAM protein with 4Fe4S-binding SPASM domain